MNEPVGNILDRLKSIPPNRLDAHETIQVWHNLLNKCFTRKWFRWYCDHNKAIAIIRTYADKNVNKYRDFIATAVTNWAMDDEDKRPLINIIHEILSQGYERLSGEGGDSQ